MPPLPLLYLGGASRLQQGNLFFRSQLVRALAPHLIYLCVASMFGTAQNREHGGKLHSWRAMRKSQSDCPSQPKGCWVASPGRTDSSFKHLRKLKDLSLASWLLDKKGENTTSSFVKSSIFISFAFTSCDQNQSVSFWGSEGGFQCKIGGGGGKKRGMGKRHSLSLI